MKVIIQFSISLSNIVVFYQDFTGFCKKIAKFAENVEISVIRSSFAPIGKVRT